MFCNGGGICVVPYRNFDAGLYTASVFRDIIIIIITQSPIQKPQDL